jgi:hypothetical protein
LLTVLTTHAFAIDRINFQGLDGTSTPTDIKRKFPGAAPQNGCYGGESVRKAADGIYSCTYLEADNYKVNGLDFTVDFNFNTDNTLRGVWKSGQASNVQ